MSIMQVMDNFRNTINEGQSFISLAHNQDISGNYIHSDKARLFISESAFLRIFIAWEEFTEGCFLEFMMGEPSLTGKMIPKYVSPPDLLHAQKLVIGTQKYIDWSNPETVRRLSKLYFDKGYPFDPFISSINQDLLDLRTIRNSSAHLSSTTNHQLDALGTRKLKRFCSNLRVYDLVFALDPDSTSGSTILDNYLKLLVAAAEGIANA